MKKTICLIMALILVAMIFTGCKDDVTVGDVAVDQFDIKVNNEKLRGFAEGACIQGSNACVEYMNTKNDRIENGELTINGIGCGNTIEDAVNSFDVEPGCILFNYEYDPYGDGCTEIGDIIYDGVIPSSEELSALDIAVIVCFRFDNGTWIPLNRNTDDFEKYPVLLKICFDTEGAHDLYGKKHDEIFSTECELIVSDLKEN